MVIARNQWSAGAWERTSQGRYLSVGFVILLHAGLIYALLTAIGFQLVTPPPPNLVVRTLRPTEPPRETPVLTEPRFAAPAVQVPISRIEPSITIAPTMTEVRPTPEAVPVATAMPPPAKAAVARVAPRIDLARSTKPPYPALSRRLLEQGTVVLNVLVGATGDVLDVMVKTSSGHSRLDQAAIEGVRQGYHFLAATEGDHPVEAWQAVTVTFHLNDSD